MIQHISSFQLPLSCSGDVHRAHIGGDAHLRKISNPFFKKLFTAASILVPTEAGGDLEPVLAPFPGHIPALTAGLGAAAAQGPIPAHPLQDHTTESLAGWTLIIQTTCAKFFTTKKRTMFEHNLSLCALT